MKSFYAKHLVLFEKKPIEFRMKTDEKSKRRMKSGIRFSVEIVWKHFQFRVYDSIDRVWNDETSEGIKRCTTFFYETEYQTQY